MHGKNVSTGQLTCRRPSRVLGIVTHLVGCAPLVVTAVMRLSSSSRFSFSFLTRLLIASFVNDSLSPPYTATESCFASSHHSFDNQQDAKKILTKRAHYRQFQVLLAALMVVLLLIMSCVIKKPRKWLIQSFDGSIFILRYQYLNPILT